MPKLFALLALLVGIAGLVIDAWMIFPSLLTVTAANPVARSFPDAFINFWTYFTHLTNLGLVLVYLSELTGSRSSHGSTSWHSPDWWCSPFVSSGPC